VADAHFKLLHEPILAVAGDEKDKPAVPAKDAHDVQLKQLQMCVFLGRKRSTCCSHTTLCLDM
ncbi:hypothetical protein L7F22_041533, partial [Adiantum nelumboides]|nr:hypothetical protein [Adiantum nelumboides]